MQRRTPAMAIGSLRVSPFVVGLVTSLMVHAVLLGALNFVPRRSMESTIVSPAIEFSLGEPIIITDTSLPEIPPEALAFRDPSDPPRGLLPWRALEPRDVVVEQFEPRDPPKNDALTTVAPPLIVTAGSAVLLDEIKVQPRCDPPHPVHTDVLAIAEEALPPTDDPPGVSRGVEIVRMPAPAYPTSCRRLGHQGTVLVQVHVRADGRVATVRIAQRSVCEHLDQAAVDAVRTARFRPAADDGTAIDSIVLIPFRFQLR